MVFVKDYLFILQGKFIIKLNAKTKRLNKKGQKKKFFKFIIKSYKRKKVCIISSRTYTVAKNIFSILKELHHYISMNSFASKLRV